VTPVEPSTSREQPGNSEPAGDGTGAALEVGAFVLALAAYLYLIGWITNWARLSAARLPIDVVAALPAGRILGDGLRSTVLTAAVFALLCVLAYYTSARRWEVNGQDWHDIVLKKGIGGALAIPGAQANRDRRREAASSRREASRARLKERFKPVGRSKRPNGTSGPPRPVAQDPQAPAQAVQERAKPTLLAPIGETGVRIVAGFNILMLAAVLASAAAVSVNEFFPPAWWVIIVTWIAVFLALHEILTRLGPLRLGPHMNAGWWLLVAGVALFASAPLGALVLIGVTISTLGRAIGRLDRPSSIRACVRSPLPWILLTIVALIGLAYQAMAPVSFLRAVVVTNAGATRTGGYLARTTAGVYLATCTQRVDATSTNERVELVTSSDIKTIALGGPPENFDSGARPSLATLALHALGIDESAPTLVSADLRPRRGTCAGSTVPATGKPEPALGAGVLEGPAPPDGQAHDGELPIERTAPAWVAQLARLYQPIVEVSSADRFWPVSVGALLADRGPNGEPTCLVQKRTPTLLCEPSLSNLERTGSQASDYLQFPVRLSQDPSPNGQFEAFERGQGIAPGPLEQWLTDPGVLRPWYTAQVYFYDAGELASSQWPEGARDPRVKSGLITLEYWFYYPYNYFPLVVRSQLMPDAPIAADRLNVDYHQGDWEHIDVLLDPHTHTPLWLYMARHSDEGQFVPWASAPNIVDQTHPVVQAAFGGHPTYGPSCGRQLRPKTRNALGDWLVCRPFRFGFSANDTPLVDIANTPWACWAGHFGEAIPGVELGNGQPETLLDELRHQVLVAGPVSPLQQAENSGVCTGDPRAPELTPP
jgi:hypothetical protein